MLFQVHMITGRKIYLNMPQMPTLRRCRRDWIKYISLDSQVYLGISLTTFVHVLQSSKPTKRL